MLGNAQTERLAKPAQTLLAAPGSPANETCVVAALAPACGTGNVECSRRVPGIKVLGEDGDEAKAPVAESAHSGVPTPSLNLVVLPQ
jgi:hypothetical protein